ncbi:hypothetical protein [Bradyrhizobium cytisi]|uniref:hypothetical protein n=1 Tax=Bradyrhizobium cytisi TaxID=515489 RepID=UPI003D321250
MQRDFFWDSWFVLQRLDYPLSFGIQSSRPWSENRGVAVPFCDRIYQSFDFPVDLTKLLLKALPFCI